MEKGGNSGNIGARKPILALGELLVDLVPGREGMRIEDAGPVVKTASGSAGIFACRHAAGRTGRLHRQSGARQPQPDGSRHTARPGGGSLPSHRLGRGTDGPCVFGISAGRAELSVLP